MMGDIQCCESSDVIDSMFCVYSLVKEKLTADPDSEIATTSLRVSLLCPVCNGPSTLNKDFILFKGFC